MPQNETQSATASPSVEGQPIDADNQDAQVQNTTSLPTETASESSQSNSTGIILNIRDNSWVEIRDSTGKRLISRVLKAGDKYFVPNRPDLTMSLGNAGGVGIQVDGQSIGPLGRDAQVRRNIPLDTKYLKNKYAPTQ